MSDEAERPAGENVLEVDGVLAAALAAQGEAGVRALGLLRDARRVLAGVGLEQPEEVAEACLRSAADALLRLPGAPDAPEPVGLQSAARNLLAALDALPAPAGPSDAPQPAAGRGRPGTRAGASAGWEQVQCVAQALHREVVRPGGYHRGRAAGIAERLMGVKLGAAQETALDVWGEVYGKASGTLHGAAAETGRPARLYAEVLAAARELLVPLPGRADRVLELTALEHPGPAQARELARWADPRATAFFFRSGPAPAWLKVLDEHAPHLLMPDAAAGGTWPAAPFLTHLADTSPEVARAWLADHAEKVAAAGRPALDEVLRLAARGDRAVAAAQVRAVLAQDAARTAAGEPGGLAGGWTLRLAATWARKVALPERDGHWIAVVEQLLTGAVDAEHLDARSRRSPAERAALAEERIASGTVGVFGLLLDDVDDEADWDRAARTEAARLPETEIARLLRELVRTAHPAGPAGGPHPRVRTIRAVAAGLLRRDVEQTAPAARRIVFRTDLDHVRPGEPAAFGGPRLARTVLDLAAADADAGASLAERTAQWKKFAGLDRWLHDRLLAAHLTARPPAPGNRPPPGPYGDSQAAAAAEGEWWTQACALVARLLADRPDPEPARLVETLWRTCPPDATDQLETAARTALGAPPDPREVERVLAAGAERLDGTAEPLGAWLRVWDWSPVLPARALAGFAPLLAALRRIRPAGPADPRTAAAPEPVRATPALDAEDLRELAAARGPAAAAGALAAAEDAGADGYAIVLHHLVAADPAAWTADVPGLLEALDRPALRAFYLLAAAASAHHPDALAGESLPQACAAALQMRRTFPNPGAGQERDVLLLADQAVVDLLTHAWHTDTDLRAGLTDALAHLHTLAGALTRPAASTPDPQAAADETAQAGGPLLLGSDPEVRALGCLIDYATYRARTGGKMPDDVLHLLAGALAARGDHNAVATAIGVRLPALHHHAPDFATTHRTALYALPPAGWSPAAAWLRWGPVHPPLLAALDRTELLAALRAGEGGPAEHLAHALTGDPDFLGDPSTAWQEIAAGPGGAAAVSWLLELLATRLAPARMALMDGRLNRVDAGAAQPATEPAAAAVTVLWRAALEAGLPPGALAGAGAFARAALDDSVWLSLARRSAEHTPAQTEAGLLAERAASHPRSPDALLLAAYLLTRPAPAPWYDAEVRWHARTLLQAAAALPAADRPAETGQLRQALVEAGEVDIAQTPTTAG
ncbi:hypothetical protein [Streptomyces nigrescens]|uniref:hypothetical protein n=1 Tax=Streptomyces nigrescens TaxID=1920 RepID=UPI0036FFB98C